LQYEIENLKKELKEMREYKNKAGEVLEKYNMALVQLAK